MKTLKRLSFGAVMAAGLWMAVPGRADDAPAPTPPPAEEAPPAPAEKPAQEAAIQKAPENQQPPVVITTPPADGLLRLNFRGVPLEMVLNYLSEAAGFIIHPKVDVKGKVDVWSSQPLSKDEAVKLLKQILSENGYTTIQDDRTLTIVRTEDAKKNDIPVKSGNNPSDIPKNADVVTQIIPVRSLNAVQLVKDLAPLFVTDNVIANESGNSLVMTDTQQNIRRITEIIKALDSVSSSVNSIRVFPLKFADAKAMVAVVKELFPTQDSSRNGGGNSGFGRFRGGGFGGFNPFGGPPGGGGTDTSGSGHTPNTRVSAVSDDHSNSLIVSAPEELMESINELVKSIDTPVEEITAVQVFHLKNADPGEMADLLTNLFPDDTGSTDMSRSGPQFRFGPFGGGPFGGGGGRQNNSTTESDRMKRMGRVIAVPDRRTASLVVTASTNVLTQISSMIEELDENPAKKQKVFVYSLENATPQEVQQVLDDLFQSNTTSRNSRSGTTQNDALTTRQTRAMQNGTSTSGFGSGFGNGSSSGRIGF